MPSGEVLGRHPRPRRQAEHHVPRGSQDPGRRSRKYRTELVDTCLEHGRRGHGGLSRRRRGAVGRRPARVPAQGHHHRRLHPGAVRLLVQEQGRAAGAGRRRRLSAGPDRRRGDQDRGRRRQPDRRAQVLGRRAVLGAGLQGHQRRLRRADLRARLFRRAHQGRLGAELDARQAREDRPHGRDVRQGSQSDRRSPRRRHHRASSR